MSRILALCCLLAVSIPLSAQATAGGKIALGGKIKITVGQPVISALAESPDANSVLLSWTTNVPANTSASCGGLNAPYDASQNSVTSHQIPVPQLAPSSGYTCRVCSSGTCQTISASTAAYAASTPITGISFGTIFNYNTTPTPPHTMTGDTFWNTKSSDGINYILAGDTTGYNGNPDCYSPGLIGKLTSTSPIVAADVNPLSGYGPGCVPNASAGNLRPHPVGLMSMAGKLFMTWGIQTQCNGVDTCPWFYGSMIFSPDHGLTWNTQTSPATFTTTGGLNSPYTARMWPNGPPYYDASQFVMQGADDGTLGYATASNRVLNANAYIYGISGVVTGTGSGSSAADSYSLWRVPRSQIADLKPSEYQFYVGGDGTQPSAWSSTQTSAASILTNDCNGANLPATPGCLGEASVQYVPALNRYLLVTYYWVNGVGTAAHTKVLAYDAPAPWGPFTLVTTVDYPTQGYYDHIILQADALAATFSPTTMRVVLTGQFSTANYNMFYSTITVAH